MKLKRGTHVTVEAFDGKVINSITDTHGNIIGYRVTDSKRPAFWCVVPTYLVQENKDA